MSKNESAPMAVQGREIDQFAPIPSVRDAGETDLARDIEKFAGKLVQHCETLRRECSERCHADNFLQRLDRDNLRAVGKLQFFYDGTTGKLLLDQGDGHCFYGLTMGLSSQGIRAAAAYLRRKILLEPQRPYTLTGRGARTENKKLEELLYAVLDDLLERGHFNRCVELLCNVIPRHPLSVVRYEMGAAPQFVQGRDGAWHEEPPEIAPTFRVWPIENVVVSNVRTPYAEDQECVFWLTPLANLLTLQEDEALFMEMETEPGRYEQKRIAGKFQNLEALRLEAADSDHMKNFGGEGITSSFPTYTLVEIEGALPMQHWVAKKDLTPEVAAWFNFNVGEQAPDKSDESEMEEWGRRLGRIPVWQVAYLTDPAPRSGSTSRRSQHLLRCEPDLSKRPRNSAFAFRYFQDGFNWYGRSLPDLGQGAEKACDLALNAKIASQHLNSRAPIAIDTSAFKNKSVADIQAKISTPDAVLEMLGTNRRIEDCIKRLFVEEPRDGLQVIQLNKQTFEDQTGIRSALKGNAQAPSTGTLGEIQIDESKSAQELDAMVHGVFTEIARLIGCVVEDFFHYLEPDTALKYVERVSGMAGSDIRAILPSVDGIERDVRVGHPLSASNDAAVLTTLLMKIFQLVPDAFPDRVGFAKGLMEMAGYARGAVLAADSATMAAEDEHGQMRQGTLVEPDPKEDFLDHLNKHSIALSEAQQRLAQAVEEPDPEDLNLIALLPSHLEATLGLYQAVLMQMAASAPAPGGAAAGGSSEPGAGIGTREGKSAPATGAAQKPQTTQEMGSDIRGQARGVAK